MRKAFRLYYDLWTMEIRASALAPFRQRNDLSPLQSVVHSSEAVFLKKPVHPQKIDEPASDAPSHAPHILDCLVPN
jgi:hypothetical protein